MINVNEVAEWKVVDLLSNLFSSIAYLDADTVRCNFELGCSGVMTETDRSISAELVEYLVNHFALIFMGLIANKKFRNAFMEAVMVEMSLMDRDSGFVRKIRREMNEGVVYSSDEKCVIDFGRYNDRIFRWVEEGVLRSFDRLGEYYEVIDELVFDLSQDDIIDIGFVISNFMYLLRAFSWNGLFTDYVKSVIKTVQETLNLKEPAVSICPPGVYF